ncbi:GGDEF domain-containing protein [Sulfurimonas marina]|uniref:diguanylate cyclase n=1 Tax=Sulfurimonas marina TaxID=2590551 RepID=A0A7M1AXK9_9BACT|nr:GGDEF domain-containing protein [Sulfurimonas marina]QOP42183.1 GGDEF domain-containing protein [Sulfurimonas marina]
MINNSTFLTTIDIIPNPLIVTNGEKILLSNKSFLDFLGLESLEQLQTLCKCVCHLFIEYDGFFSLKDLKDGELWVDYIYRQKEGVKVSMVSNQGEGKAFEVSVGKLEEYEKTYVVIFTDITSLESERKILEKLAYKDPLTDIYNRQIFNTMLKQAYTDKHKNGERLSIILLDIDHFKQVNDNYGHDVGDKVLIEFTKLINQHIRSSDIFARWGGEEFIILLPKADIDAAYRKAEELRLLVENFEDPYLPKITISLGVSEILDGDKERSCFKRADKALYKAKETRNKAVKL